MLHRILAIFILLAFANIGPACAQDFYLDQLADKLSAQLSTGDRSIIAVVNFTNDKYGPQYNAHLVSRLSIRLTNRGKNFQVVNRSRINEVQRELQKRYQNGFDEKAFVELGKLVGAQAIITGDFTVAGGKLTIGAQILDVKTGVIVGGGEVAVPLDDEVKDLLGPPVSSASGLNSPGRNIQSQGMGERVSGGEAIVGEQEAGGVIVRLHGCSLLGSSASCNFTFLSNSIDTNLQSFYGSPQCGTHSRAFDQEGREYPAASVSFGEKSGDCLQNLLLVRDTPTRGKVVIHGLSSSAAQFNLLQVVFSILNSNSIHTYGVEFRKVPLTR